MFEQDFAQARARLLQIVDPELLRSNAVQYLESISSDRNDKRWAISILKKNKLEYGEIRAKQGAVYKMSITVKSDAGTVLAFNQYGSVKSVSKNSPIKTSILDAINASLPAEYFVDHLEPRFAPKEVFEASNNLFSPDSNSSSQENQQVHNQIAELVDTTSEMKKQLEVMAKNRATSAKPVSEEEISIVFRILIKLQSEHKIRKAPLSDVFARMVIQGLSVHQTAKKLNCSVGLISGRKKLIEEKIGKTIDQLRNHADQFNNFHQSVKGDTYIKKKEGQVCANDFSYEGDEIDN